MKAKAVAIFNAEKHCNHMKFEMMIMQTDSLAIQKILTKEWDCPWSIAKHIQQI